MYDQMNEPEQPSLIERREPEYHDGRAKKSNLKPILGTLVVVLAVIGAGVGGWAFRGGEVREGEAAIAALKKDIKQVRGNLADTRESLADAEADLSDANNRATAVENTLEDCAAFAERQVENILTLLDVGEALIDDRYYSAIELMNDVEPPSEFEKDICTVGEGDGQGV